MPSRAFVDYLLRHIPVDLHEKVKAQAEREGITLRVVIIQLLQTYVKRGKDT